MGTQICKTEVQADWVDYNGHMNDAEYARVFSQAVDAFMAAIGLDEAGREEHQITIFTLETHLCYLAEAHRGEMLHVQLDILDRDAKRAHVFFTLRNANSNLVATSEQMLMAMSTDTGRPSPLPEAIEQQLAGLGQLAPDDWPPQAGQKIGIRYKG